MGSLRAGENSALRPFARILGAAQNISKNAVLSCAPKDPQAS